MAGLQPKTSQKLVAPAGGKRKRPGATPLSCCDCFFGVTASSRAWGFKDAQLDGGVLAKALRATVTDLPMLAGRLRRDDETSTCTLRIEHTGEGAELTVASHDDLSLQEAMSPDAWAKEQGFTISKVAVPFYIPAMDTEGGTPAKLMAGQIPLLMVRLSKLRDGCILGVTVAHALKDGNGWPLLMNHLAAHYRHIASGKKAPLDTAALVKPCDRSVISPDGLAKLLGVADRWQAPPDPVSVTFGAILNVWKYVFTCTFQSRGLHFLHLPKEQVAALKRLAAEGNPAGAPPITTGDAVQAASAMLMHAALGQPLVPQAPMGVALMATHKQVPAGFFGNALWVLKANGPAAEEPRAAPGDYAGALQQLARGIRAVAAEFHTNGEVPCKMMHEVQCMVRQQAGNMFSYWFGKRGAEFTCWVNYVPKQQDPDFGVGAPLYDREHTSPRQRDMAVIRPSCAPYSEGLFVQLCLTPGQWARVKAHPLLAAVMPQACWVGESG